jgi:hypothetical protein
VNLCINNRLNFTVVELSEDWHYVVIDDFLANPDQLVEYGSRLRDEFLYPERAYPGGVLPLDGQFLTPVNQFIRREMSQLFPFSRAGLRCQSQLCLTTLQPANFTWIQRLCHTDPAVYPGKTNYASLLYLFDDTELGGTAFFRWKDQDYWREMTARQQLDPAVGLAKLEQKFQLFRDPPCYMTGSNEVAELLDEVPAKFNRLVFYPGDLPHGACIRFPERLGNDPLTGRLTLNTFIAANPM